MALRFLDPDATTTAEVDGVVFTIGYWPPREAEKIGAGIAAIRKVGQDTEEARRMAFEVHRRMVEYGLRAFDGALAGAIETETIYGRTHPRVSDRVLHQLYLNHAIWPLGMACLKWNSLSEDEKKASG